MAKDRYIQTLSQEFLKSILSYDPETGVFIYKVYRNRGARKGQEAGSIHWKGYRYIVINKKSYAAHRLAFLYMNGHFPEKEVDHINCKKADNRWVNLRECSRAENIRNSPSYKGDLPKGVKSYVNKNGTTRYKAVICYNNKRYNLGVFRTAELAHTAYCEKSKELHGEFSNTAKMLD